MLRIGIRDLKNGLSQTLRQVQRGETVEVTDHGRPIARIVKAWPSRSQQLVAEGRLLVPEGAEDLLNLGPPPPLQPGEQLGSVTLAQLRADER
ncbi:MAG: type II toxin-antitoxin system Phd/YefM family antitoxin [Candidatus Dormibacter sp.]|uniref:type II toxin-antitoxin system Phd/YefM family antitoxin n=1 Tax=Candidatus Dormibacter sp. TaxID=2973982 RepID=UPI000DB47FE0|nr:MAG: prevent-host-death family protein [Candidatus Dormibacteraeota bacterium]